MSGNSASDPICIDVDEHDMHVQYDGQYREFRDDSLRPPPPDPRLPLEFRVERVLATRVTADGVREFRIKWFGYPRSEATWEPHENLNCEEAIQHFVATRTHFR